MEITIDHRDYGTFRSVQVNFGDVVLVLTIRPEVPLKVVDIGDDWIDVIDAHGGDDKITFSPDRTAILTGRAQIGVSVEDAKALLRVFRGEWPLPVDTAITLAALAAYYAPESPEVFGED